jgi:hypothetical protein
MILLAIVPPLFFYIMNPRVKSIKDAQKGIVNHDQWNLEMPMTADDKKRKIAAYVYFGVVSVIFTALLFV